MDFEESLSVPRIPIELHFNVMIPVLQIRKVTYFVKIPRQAINMWFTLSDQCSITSQYINMKQQEERTDT